jgi:hypothetical protein
VTNLERDAFTVYENGKPQPITLFGREDVPVSIGLLIDNSGRMRPLRARKSEAYLAEGTRDRKDPVVVRTRPGYRGSAR